MRIPDTKSLSTLGLAVALACGAPASADVLVWQGSSTEDQVKNFAGAPGDGSTDSPATGTFDVRYDTSNGYLYFDISWDGLLADLTKLHVHGPADASASTPLHIFDIFNEADLGPAGVDVRSDRVRRNLPYIDQLLSGSPGFDEETGVQHMVDGLAYVNVHSFDYPMGEIRGNLGTPVTLVPMPKQQQKCWGLMSKGYGTLLKAVAKQTGLCLKSAAAGELSAWAGTISEDQVNNWAGLPGDGSTDSPATGELRVVYDAGSDALNYEISWNGLVDDLTKLHVHGPADASSSTPNHIFDIFNELDLGPAGVDLRSDSIDVNTTYDEQLTVGAPTFDKATGLSHMLAEMTYVNVHSLAHPMGEIRGNLLLADGVSACIRSDFKGGVAKARAKLEALLADKCSGASYPGFGTQALADDFVSLGSEAAEDVTVRVMGVLFGPAMDAAMTADKATAKCQQVTVKKVGKCADAIVKEHTKCTGTALKGKKTTTAVDALGVELCLEGDPKGKIAKACSAPDGPLGKVISKKCTDIAGSFPGAGTSDLATLLDFVSTEARCATCLAANAVYDVAADCDAIDNGAADASCS